LLTLLHLLSAHMSEVESIIQTIKHKTELLGIQKIELTSKLNKLEVENTGLKSKLADQQQQFEQLKEKNNVLKVAKSLSDSGEKSTEAKRRINELVKEIDKCIALLNK
jgi:predicted RNase H-like nuclease (RuvC/YqgF family)